MPIDLLSNRTPLAAFFLTFLHITMTIWVLYSFPISFKRLSAPKSADLGYSIFQQSYSSFKLLSLEAS